MIFNEGFVMLRHVSPIAKQLREELIKDWGDRWQQIHSTFDWLWIVLVALGMYLDNGHRWHDLALLSLVFIIPDDSCSSKTIVFVGLLPVIYLSKTIAQSRFEK